MTKSIVNSNWIREIDRCLSIKYPYREFNSNPLSLSWIHYLCRELTFIWLFVSRINVEFTICLANSLSIHGHFSESTLNSKSPVRSQKGSHFLFRDFTFNCSPFSRINFESTISNALSLPPIHFEFTICIANSSWIHYLFSEFLFNALPFSRINFAFTISLANWLAIHYCF